MPLIVPSSRRGIAGLAIVLLWLAGLGALALRELRPERSAVLAEAGRRVTPGDYWYLVERDGRAVGYFTSRVDTLPAEIQLRDALHLDPEPGDTVRSSVTASVRLSRALELLEMDLAARSGRGIFAVTGAPEGDSALRLVVRSGADSAPPQRVPTGGRAVPITAVPLLVALPQAPTVGLRVPVRVFDPTGMTVRPTVFTVVAESLFVVSDSAERAPDGRWAPAHRDTVRAWHVRAEDDSASVAAWVDAQGRIVHARLPGGLSVMRTSFEEAYLNDRRLAAGDSARSSPPPSPPTTP